MREATIYRRKNLHTFSVQLQGCPGFVEVSCSKIEVDDREKFLDLVDASSPLDDGSLVRVSITVGCYCLKKRAFVDCVIHRVLQPGEILEDPWFPEEKVPVDLEAHSVKLVAPVRRSAKRWCSGNSAVAQLLLGS